MLHAERLGAGEVAMGGAAGSGVGVERGSLLRKKIERETTGYAQEEIRCRGCSRARACVGLVVCVRVWRGLCCVRGILFLISSFFVNY